jgi:hypothetical protein
MAKQLTTERLRACYGPALGFTDEVLARIGLFLIAWARLEDELELLIWQSSEFPNPGQRPATDKMMASDKIDLLRKIGLADVLVDDAQLIRLCNVMDNLLRFRNAISHGVPTPQSADGKHRAKSISNYPWHGEKRGRPIWGAPLTLEHLDKMLGALDAIYEAFSRGKLMSQLPEKLGAVVKSPTLELAETASAEVVRDGLIGITYYFP